MFGIKNVVVVVLLIFYNNDLCGRAMINTVHKNRARLTCCRARYGHGPNRQAICEGLCIVKD